MHWRTHVLWLGLMAVEVSSGARAQAPAVGRAALVGTVLTDSLEKPVPNAEVTLTDLGVTVKTDSSGNFTLNDVPAGSHALEIRADNFAMLRVTLVFNANEAMSRDFLLRREKDSRLRIGGGGPSSTGAGRLAEFEARRKMGGGRFITRDVFEQSNGRQPFSDILTNKIPGLLIVSNTGERSVATASRGSITFSNTPGEAGKKKQCYVQVIVDNIVMYRSTPGEKLFSIDAIDPTDVAAVEFYTVSQTPLQFNSTGGAPCGTLVIWTRG